MGADDETVKTHVRPRCFMDVAVDNILLGRIVYELFDDFCPLTCENFRFLCTGEKGLGKNTGKPLHYQGTIFHRVVKSFMVQCGDFSAGNGTGGESIFGGTFQDENFDLKHDQPFLLSMANRGPDTNGSQFFITTQSSPHLDGIHVVFGRVVSGQPVVMQIEELGVDNNSRPLQDAKVVKCGELILKSKIKESVKSTSDSESSSGSDDDKRIKRKQKKKDKESKKTNEKLDDTKEVENNDAEPDGQLHPLASVSNIDPEEIPVGPPNRFLSRGGPSSMFLMKPQSDSEDKPKKRSRIRGVTKSGRIVKGRGTLRFRTPSRSRSRSYTPPHWRQEQKKMISFNEFEKMEIERKKKEEEIKRREEARKKRHEEKEKRDKSKEGGKTPPGTPPKGSNKQSVKAEIDMMAKIEDVFQIIRDRNLKNSSENHLNNKKSEFRYFDSKKKENRRSFDGKKLDRSYNKKSYDNKKPDRSYDRKKSDRLYNNKKSDQSYDLKKSDRSFDGKKTNRSNDVKKSDRSYDGKKLDRSFDSKKSDRSNDKKKKSRSNDKEKLQKVEKKIDRQSRSHSPKRQSNSHVRKDRRMPKDEGNKRHKDDRHISKFTQEEKRNRSKDKEHFIKKKKNSRRSSSSSSEDHKHKKKFKNGNSFSLSPEVKD